mmetsp:Transcript_4021/g.15143  ORF Transcript_4021/g.15143 Transcript_4021/m.15143 type:complete len:88 (-) Transcript_4021:4153-4416(-)
MFEMLFICAAVVQRIAKIAEFSSKLFLFPLSQFCPFYFAEKDCPNNPSNNAQGHHINDNREQNTCYSILCPVKNHDKRSHEPFEKQQ